MQTSWLLGTILGTGNWRLAAVRTDVLSFFFFFDCMLNSFGLVFVPKYAVIYIKLCCCGYLTTLTPASIAFNSMAVFTS